MSWGGSLFGAIVCAAFSTPAPGLIETPMLASMNAPARDKLTNKIPMRRTGRPEDIAEAAAFLAGEAAGYITGIVLDVDGGISIGSSIR
jgi:3-oxoacyl-[acyl-carrier protein] reductase